MSKPLIFDPRNKAPIKKIHVWLSVDEDGNEGIMAHGTVDQKTGFMHPHPLIASSDSNIARCEAIAKEAAKFTTKSIVRATFFRDEAP